MRRLISEVFMHMPNPVDEGFFGTFPKRSFLLRPASRDELAIIQKWPWYRPGAKDLIVAHTPSGYLRFSVVLRPDEGNKIRHSDRALSKKASLAVRDFFEHQKFRYLEMTVFWEFYE